MRFLAGARRDMRTLRAELNERRRRERQERAARAVLRPRTSNVTAAPSACPVPPMPREES